MSGTENCFENIYKRMARYTASNIRRDYYSGKPLISHVNREEFYKYMSEQKDISDIIAYVNGQTDAENTEEKR